MKKVFLIVSIDTECDKGPGWKIKFPMAFRNITEGVPDLLMPLFERYKVKPTYLLSPEIMHDDLCVRMFNGLKHVELGTHLHEEFIEPVPKWDANRTKSIQRDLDPSLEKQKLANLTELFERRFGHKPTSFRAGRFGISRYTLYYLDDLGYLVDSSVTPYKTHYYESGTINNFWGERPFPYQVEGKDILQVPVTIINRDFSALPGFILRRLEDKRSLSKKILNRLGYKSRSEWFRPYRSTAESLIAVAEEVVRSCPKEKDPVLNMMFHSNEIIPGASPYCQTANEVDQFLRTLTETFEHLFANYDVCSTGLGEYASYFR